MYAIRSYYGPGPFAEGEDVITSYSIHYTKLYELHEGDPFPYGMTAANCRAVACWEHSCKTYDIPAKIAAIKAADDPRYARGCACMPICFGISFTAIPVITSYSIHYTKLYELHEETLCIAEFG